MKKNLALRIASGLMLSCLLTSCVISGTFAKYVSTGSATDTARVAKWGVTVTVTGNDAFATAYDVGASADAQTVVSSDGDNVLAPGTSGNLVSYEIVGQPEVDVTVSKVASFELTGNWVIDYDKDGSVDDFYCPLTIAGVSGLNYNDADAFEAAVLEAIVGEADGNVQNDKQANDDLAENSSFTWSWAISDATGTSLDQTDVADTALGDAAAAADLGISFSLTVTVTQIN